MARTVQLLLSVFGPGQRRIVVVLSTRGSRTALEQGGDLQNWSGALVQGTRNRGALMGGRTIIREKHCAKKTSGLSFSRSS